MKIRKRKSVRHAGFTIRKRTIPGGGIRWRLEEWQGNRLIRSTFETLDAAKGAAQNLRQERNRIGAQADEITDAQRNDAVRALTLLSGHASLETAAQCWLRYHRPAVGTLSFTKLVDAYLVDAAARNLRPSSLRDLRSRLLRMTKALADTPCTALDTATLDSWLDSQKLTPANRRNWRTVIHGLFAWAVEQKHSPDNPATKLRKVKVETGMPRVFNPAQVEAIMRAAEAVEKRMLPYLSLAFFAGIRPTELTRLTWGDIDLAAGTVTVRSEVAKKRRSRIIALADNCKGWLLASRPQAAEAGSLIVSSYMTQRRDLETVRKAAKVGMWPPDVARHCFGTYHLALHGDISRTCLDMGHTSPDVLFQHYRNLSTKELAAAFFAIQPKAEDNAIPFRVAAG